MHRILIVEDEARVASFVEQGLTEEGFAVTWLTRGEEAVRRVRSETFDLLVLDRRLPDITGIEVCREIRLVDPRLPILMLTALDAVEDRVAGLKAGADDYLPKPFAFEELLARIYALLRRRDGQGHDVLRAGSVTLDRASRTCIAQGRSIDLTQKEFDLLAYFLARPNQALHRDDIHRDVWGNDFDRGTNLIDVYVGYLRRKLRSADVDSTIDTVRGVGYRFTNRGERP